MGERIGIFGGTFDPPHTGHLVTAINVHHTLALDRFIFMVANEAWHKPPDHTVTPAYQRLALVHAAVAGHSGLEAGNHEIVRGGPSHTADTVAELRRQHRGAELYTIVGSDVAAGLDTWERLDGVLTHSRIVVVDRPGHPARIPAAIPAARVVAPRLELSSSDLRARFADGRPVELLIPAPVVQLIDRLGLYRQAAGS